jgi:hypothetical protein
MDKQFIIAWFVLFVVWMFGGFVVHGTLLRGDYAQLPNLFRPEAEAQQFFPLMLLAHLLMAGGFAWIYAHGREAKPWLVQGVRFGIAVAVLTVIPTYTIYFVVQPMPGAVVAKQIVFDSILLVVLGMVVAFLYRGSASGSRAVS